MKLNIQLFSSTNKTTNYELSQYIGTDKPTYLGDYNSDMGKIDTAIHTNATAISENAGNITINSNKIGTLSNLETTSKADLVSAINEVNTNTGSNTTNIGSLSNLTTTNKSTIVNAINEVNGNVSNLQPVTLWTNPDTSQNFDPADINIANDTYAYFEIECLYGPGDNRIFTSKIYPNQACVVNYVYFYNGQIFSRDRAFTHTTGKISVDAGIVNGNVGNAILIPYKIIGYKA